MRRLAAATLALESGVGAALASLVLTRFTVHAGSDFAVYYAGARALRLAPTANIYLWPVIQAGMSSTGACWLIPSPFVYPPLLAILLEPLTFLPCSVAIYAWQILNALFLSGALYLMSRIWSLSLGTYTLLCAATLMSFPVLQGLYYGQIHTLILFGLMLSLWRYSQRDWLGAGIVIGVIAWIQVIPGLFIGYFLLRRDWRAAVSVLVTGALLLAGMLVVVGAQGMLNFLHSIGHSYSINRETMNASLLFQFGLWSTLTVLATYALVLWRHRGGLREGYLWTIVTMILVSPIAWPYFLLWIFPAFLSWWLRKQRWLRWLILALYLPLYFSNNIVAIPMAVLIIAWLMLGWEYLRSVATSGDAPEPAGGAAHEPQRQPLAEPAPRVVSG